jgi:transglutaminase-like putative cysteine protease
MTLKDFLMNVQAFCFVFSLFASHLLSANPYPVSSIPPELRKEADVVVRLMDVKFSIHAKNKATYAVHEVYTILNANGKRYAIEGVSYDKLSKVTLFKGIAYDSTGRQIKKMKSSEILDQSYISGYSLYEDNRVKVADLAQGRYPYTVEFEYEVEFNFLFYIPGLQVVPGTRVSVEATNYTLAFKDEALSPKFKTLLIDAKPIDGRDEQNYKTVQWNFKNIASIKPEPYGKSFSDLSPRIMAAPSAFEFDGYEGKMNTWNEVGQWMNLLNKERDVLPAETIQKMVKLTKDLPSTEEKVKAVYEYLQNKTRYVSIQLGIGGFQTFEAKVVDETGYGDCKALSNYTISLLKAVGIDANYVLIRAGEDAPGIDSDFVSTQFNHAIVAVPTKGDTIWLECTSQTNPFGYMGSFTGNRKALLIEKDGAKVVKTVSYPMEKNLQARQADVFLESTGDAQAKIKTSYSGLQYENDNLHGVVASQFDSQKKWIESNTRIPSFEVKNFQIVNYRERNPTAEVKVELALKRLASVSGKRLFLTPNLMNRSTFIPEKMENRRTRVVLKTPYIDTDSIRYHMPEGLYPEFLPQPTKIKTQFGEYESSVQIDKGDVLYIRKVKMQKGEFPPESYQELVDFYKNINKADHVKLVFLNKT